MVTQGRWTFISSGSPRYELHTVLPNDDLRGAAYSDLRGVVYVSSGKSRGAPWTLYHAQVEGAPWTLYHTLTGSSPARFDSLEAAKAHVETLLIELLLLGARDI